MAQAPDWRRRLRRLRMGLQTLLGGPSAGFFIPYRYADSVVQPTYGALEARLAARENAYRALLGEADRMASALRAIGGEEPPQPRWAQDWFPPLDALAAYTLVRTRKPARIVEVGSGHSTRFLARAVRDGGLDTQITAIDPQPRADLSQLDITLIRAPVQQVDRAPFAALAAGDFLMIDSSHVLMPGSDVDLLFNDVLPALPSGVVVQVHDVFLPDDYPAEWAWRGYNEQQALGPLIDGWEILFASRYVATRLRGVLDASVMGSLDAPDSPFASALWLRKP